MSDRYVLKQIQQNINVLLYNSLNFSVYLKIFKIKYRGKLHTNTHIFVNVWEKFQNHSAITHQNMYNVFS